MKAPPHSIDAERALLSSVLMDRSVFGIVRGMVTPDDFYSPTNAVLWDAFGILWDRREPIDMVTVRAQLVRSNRLAAAGGDEGILAVTDVLPWADNVESYARAVRDLSRQRRLVRACTELAAKGYEGADYAAYRAEVERVIRSITTEETDGDPVHIGGVLSDVIREADRLKKLGGAITGFSSGVVALDRFISGWNAGKLYVVAGRPGMGKSALMTSTILASVKDAPGLNFSIEMPNPENGMRILAAGSSTDLKNFAQGKLSDDDWRAIAAACQRLNGFPIYVDDRTRTIEQISAKSRKFKARHGRIGPIVVDYLQLIQGDKRLPREQQISETTRELKALAKELECPVIALSQLNRQCEERADKRPQISDLRESGAIEQDADVIVLLYRKGYYASQMVNVNSDPKKRSKWDAPTDIKPGEDDGITELIVAKQRGGPTGVVKCMFKAPSACFEDI